MVPKIMQRTNLFYIAYSISRGTSSFFISSSLDTDEYYKKCLWQIYFSTTRLKKFIFTWSFHTLRKNRQQLDIPIRDY